MIFGYTVGSGIFVLPAVVVAGLGTAGVLAYLLCTAIIALVVLVFAEAGSRVTQTGGPYAYVEIALGGYAGVLTAVLLLLSDVTAAGAVATVLGGSIGQAAGVTGSTPVAFVMAALVAAIAIVNVRGVQSGAGLVEVLTAAKLVPLLLFACVGAFFISPAHLSWTSVPTFADVARTSGTLLFAFTGIETALQPTGEVRDPARTVPRAALLALALASLLYIGVQTVAVGVSGTALAEDPVAPLASAAGRFAGETGRLVMLAGAVISTFGWLTGSILSTPRSLFALSRDGFLPRWLAAVHPRHHTPHVAILSYSVAIVALAITGSFQGLAILSNLATLAVYVLCALAVLVRRRRDVRADREPFRVRGGGIVPVLAIVASGAVIVMTVSVREYRTFGVAIGAAALIYAWRSYRLRVGASGTGDD
jgi:APA family basic amino acid/polyamine antiporter